MESQNLMNDAITEFGAMPEFGAITKIDAIPEFGAIAVTSTSLSESFSESPELVVCLGNPLECYCTTCMQRLALWKQVWYYIAYHCFTEDVATYRLYVKRSCGNHLVYCIFCTYRQARLLLLAACLFVF